MILAAVTVCFDVDGCLRSPSVTHYVRPIEDVRTLMVLLKRMECRIILWSGSGELYARQVARECGVSHLVDQFASKTDTTITPDITFDDEEMTRGKVNIRIP
jgi:phosphoserine phosphatase